MAALWLLAPTAAQAQGWVVDPGARFALPTRTCLELGGGVADFTDSEVRAYAGTSGAWIVRAVLGARSLIGGDVAYVGSSSAMDQIGLDRDARLLRHGVEANLRLSLPLRRERWTISPYAFAGVGYAHYRIVSDRFATTSFKEDDDVLLMPLGVGLAVSHRRFVVGTRFAFYRTFDAELLRSPAGGTDAHAGLDSWMVLAHVGYEL